jgi:hypothetical protein
MTFEALRGFASPICANLGTCHGGNVLDSRHKYHAVSCMLLEFENALPRRFFVSDSAHKSDLAWTQRLHRIFNPSIGYTCDHG